MLKCSNPMPVMLMQNDPCQVLILGGGISGLGANYVFKKCGINPVILEKEKHAGGLCSRIQHGDFFFDRFVHFSFSEIDEVNNIFKKSAQDIIRHIPNPYNIYKRKWIKHPAQNNLFPLEREEKEKIIDGFVNRSSADRLPSDYEHWLRCQYGDYFAEHFPMVYTRKYWMRNAREMSTDWVGKRLYQPSLEEVINGANSSDTPVTYYAKEMRYPAKGGYQGFLSELSGSADIRYGCKVAEINPRSKQVITNNGFVFDYELLFSSIPLPEYKNLIKDMPASIREACSNLCCTSGYHISIGIKGKCIPPYLWWYIYDEDILASRVYSPSLKSSDNAPEGYSSLQAEVYCEKDQYSQDELYAGTIQKFIEMGLIEENNIEFIDYNFESYANVIFDKKAKAAKELVRDYLSSLGIVTIGRFGEWEYYWSDQALMSGIRAARREISDAKSF